MVFGVVLKLVRQLLLRKRLVLIRASSLFEMCLKNCGCELVRWMIF